MQKNEFDDFFPPFSPIRKEIRKEWNKQPSHIDWYDFLEKKASEFSKSKTWLPVFPGFYCTIFEADESWELQNFEEDLNEKGVSMPDDAYNLFQWDYKSYRNSIAINCCEYVERELSGFISAIKFEAVSSPKEYNFTNDSIDVEILLSIENIKNIKTYLKDHFEAFTAYIKDRFISRSGFISFYSNDSLEWLKSIDESLEHEHKLGTILDFILREQVSNPERDMRDNCAEIYVQATNYNQVLQNLS